MIIGYVRVSSETQSLEQQKMEITNYANNHNLVVDKFIEDFGISAYKKTFDAREGLLEVLALAEQGIVSDLLLFETSRISRRYGESIGLFEKLTSKGIRIHSVVDGGVINAHEIDELLLAFRSWANQQSSKLTSERIKAKLAHLRQQGLYTGGSTLWGFTVVNKRVVPDEELRPVIIQFFNDYITHGTSYVMDKYNLNRVTINKRIKNEAYREIVGDDLWEHSNKVRTSRVCRKDYLSRTNRSNALFEGILYHNCGKKLYISYQKNGMYYRCYDCDKDNRKTYKGPLLENLIESEILHVFDDLSYEKLEEQYLLNIEKLKLVLELEQKSINADIESITNTINSLKKRLAHFLCQDDSDTVIKNISNLINEHEEELNTLLIKQDEVEAKFASLENKIDSQLKSIQALLNAKEIYLHSSNESKKSVLQLIVDKIVVTDYDQIDIYLNI